MRDVGCSLLESMVVLAIISVMDRCHVSVFKSGITAGGAGPAVAHSPSQTVAVSVTEAREVVVERSPNGWRFARCHCSSSSSRVSGFRGSRVRFYPNGSSDNGSWTLCIPPYQHPRALVLSGRLG